jgi:hypothetical protein
MKKIIKRLITRLLWDSVDQIVGQTLEDKLYPIVIFYVNGKSIEVRNMFTIPQVGDMVWIKKSLYTEGGTFKCESRVIITELGYEVHVTGTLTPGFD